MRIKETLHLKLAYNIRPFTPQPLYHNYVLCYNFEIDPILVNNGMKHQKKKKERKSKK